MMKYCKKRRKSQKIYFGGFFCFAEDAVYEKKRPFKKESRMFLTDML